MNQNVRIGELAPHIIYHMVICTWQGDPPPYHFLLPRERWFWGPKCLRTEAALYQMQHTGEWPLIVIWATQKIRP